MKITYETTDLSSYGMQIIIIWLVPGEEVMMCTTQIFEDFSNRIKK